MGSVWRRARRRSARCVHERDAHAARPIWDGDGSSGCCRLRDPRCIEESIGRYITQLETADRRGDAVPEAKVAHFKEKIMKLNEEIARLSAINSEMMKSKDKQISLTDPDARSMVTSGRDTGIVGYNVQTAVDTKNHLIVAHEVTNVGTDRHQLLNMAEQARTEMGVETLDAVADRGYY